MNVFSIVPKEVMKKSKGNRWVVLAHLRGVNGYVKAKVLAEKGGYPKSNTFVELRSDITELLLDGHPVVSSALGFKYVYDLNEVILYIKSLQTRRLGLDRRIKSLVRVYEKLSGTNSIGGFGNYSL